MIKLSIIIPVYNAEKYLEQCLTSIYNEYNDAIEVILIDDGSTDGSSRIYNNFRDKNLKIYKNTNHGVSYSRNYALTKAKGKYIMFIDADDYLKEKWFDKIHSYLDSQKDLIIFSKNTTIEMNKIANTAWRKIKTLEEQRDELDDEIREIYDNLKEEKNKKS